jgi:hypothetical protein
MRLYVRTSRRTGVSMPFWLVPLAWLLWLTALVLYYLIVLILGGAVLAGRAAGWAWRRAHRRPPAGAAPRSRWRGR